MQKEKLHDAGRAPCARRDQTAEINDRLIIRLRNLSHVMRALYEGKGSQKRILMMLNRIGTITQRELTERLGIQPGSASEVIAKLESAGLISRTPSGTDRRTADIALTDKGKELAIQAQEQRSRRHEEMFSCLSADEKSQLLSTLEKINDDWDRRYREPGKTAESGRSFHGRRGGGAPCGE